MKILNRRDRRGRGGLKEKKNEITLRSLGALSALSGYPLPEHGLA